MIIKSDHHLEMQDRKRTQDLALVFFKISYPQVLSSRALDVKCFDVDRINCVAILKLN